MLLKALKTIFEKNNYSVDVVTNGEDALSYGLSDNYDGIIMDIMMPKMSGLEALRGLRKKNISTPVLLLTAKSETTDKVEGLDAGADDYLPKPFVVAELLARVRAMLRRKGEGYIPEKLKIGNLVFDKSSYELLANGRRAKLTNKEFQIMEMLSAGYGKIITTTQFMERIWGWDSDVEISIVWTIISNIRKKLEEIGANVEIRAARGVGYVLEEKKC